MEAKNVHETNGQAVIEEGINPAGDVHYEDVNVHPEISLEGVEIYKEASKELCPIVDFVKKGTRPPHA